MNLAGSCSEAEINTALAMTGTSHLVNSEVNTLSGGEFQRVLLSRAIAKKPELLVLDEPVQGVDNTGEEAMYNLIETIAKTLNCGILLISHDLHFVMSATTHVICLNGHICCSGTPRAVSTSSEFRSLYGSKISANLALYEHMHDHTHGTDGSIEKLEEMAKNSNVSQETSIRMLDDFICFGAFLGGIGVAIVTGPLGCFVVWRRLAYFGDTLSHSALLGVALAILLEVNIMLAVFVISVLMGLALLMLRQMAPLSSDALLGLLAHSTLAIGLIALSFMTWVRVDLLGFLFRGRSGDQSIRSTDYRTRRYGRITRIER